MKKILYFILIILLSCSTCPKGSGVSKSVGAVNKGKLINGRRFPKKGKNFEYFSMLTYIFSNRAWVHSKVYDITTSAYNQLYKLDKEKRFLLMECSRESGGRMWPHRTHQNGTSIDFGVPLIDNEGKERYLHHYYGVFHYLMKFDSKGRCTWNKNIKIDFETMAQHILLLDKEARKQGMYVKKVILKINLKDDFYKTKSGKKVKAKGIYLARYLTKTIDNLHDDHYHVDFGFLK
ncbi:penicillin-insensitive murein endopeptidase [Wenyingzhuangia sp. IMCC45574]